MNFSVGKNERIVAFSDLVMADALRSDNTRAAIILIEHIEKDQVIVYERTQ